MTVTLPPLPVPPRAPAAPSRRIPVLTVMAPVSTLALLLSVRVFGPSLVQLLPPSLTTPPRVMSPAPLMSVPAEVMPTVPVVLAGKGLLL